MDILLFRAGHNTAVVLVGCVVLGVSAAVVGAFAVLRKRALMADALGHATLPGIALGFMISAAFNGTGRETAALLLGATATGVVGVLAVQGILATRRLREDAAIGAVLSVFFGVGAVLLSRIQALPGADAGGLTHLILGQTASMRSGDAWLIAGAGAFAVAVVALLYKELRLVAFDQEFARVQGWPVAGLDLAVMTLVTVVTVVGLQAVGLILVVALLIIPPAAARFWTDRLGVMLVVAGVIGGASGAGGAAVSAVSRNLPIGALIVLFAGAIFLAGLLAAPRRGIVASVVRTARLRLLVASHHRLRELLGGPSDPLGAHERLADLALRRRGLAASTPAGLVLTEAGRRRALELEHAERWWIDRFGTTPGSGPPPSADAVEHILSPGLIDRLDGRSRGGDRP
ncbi:MAG: metal ABC transporter permease [Phycisphaeraceae bacterium]|nr:MAG: metal ABC transporter permease [Phycisphaeraceae bacterium]